MNSDMPSLSNGGSAIILDGDGDIAFKQGLYNALTGKTEKLVRSYPKAFKITFGDLEQLHRKCEQMAKPLMPIAKNSNVVIYHADDNKEVFSSFDRSRVYDPSITSPVESISYEFLMLIQNPDIPKAQPYKISVRIMSLIGLQRRLRNNDFGMGSIWRLMSSQAGTIQVEIEYVDYVVARNVLSAVDSWVSALDFGSVNVGCAFMAKHSHHLPPLARSVFVVFAGWVIALEAKNILGPSPSLVLLAQFTVGAYVIMNITRVVGTYLGKIAEHGFDSVAPIGYIKLNKGDERLISESESLNKKSWVNVGAAALGGIGQSTVTKLFVAKLVKFFMQ